VFVVLGKGSRPRAVSFGTKTGLAPDRYLRTRKGHPQASSPSLWLGSKGPLTDSGVAQMLHRRCKAPASGNCTRTSSAPRLLTTGLPWMGRGERDAPIRRWVHCGPLCANVVRLVEEAAEEVSTNPVASVREASRLLSVGRTTTYALIASGCCGQLASARVGSSDGCRSFAPALLRPRGRRALVPKSQGSPLAIREP
jgi:hypothetical protein